MAPPQGAALAMPAAIGAPSRLRACPNRIRRASMISRHRDVIKFNDMLYHFLHQGGLSERCAESRTAGEGRADAIALAPEVARAGAGRIDVAAGGPR